MKFLLFLALLGLAYGRPPVREQAPHPGAGQGKPAQNDTNAEWDLGIEYNRYLQEVVQVLESDPEFRKKLENADVDQIRDGTIAHELEFVHHGVRTKLDEIKRKELERLRHLAVRQNELRNGIDRKHMKIPGHLEVQSPNFEIDDLKKLIKSTTADLEKADIERRDEFKRYEMEKKFEEEERLKHIEDEAKRAEERVHLEEMKKKHKDHGKVHHPMTKDQLEEVWETQDHMRADDWNPKTFFAMHDLNGDNQWDEDEIRVLFRKELDKVYDPNEPEDDMREREEEMERMREHVFKESDTNKDRLISFDEFIAETKREEFDNDPGWETMDMEGDHELFSDDEFRAYQAQRDREIQAMLSKGVVPPGYPYYGNVPPGAQAYQPPHMQAPHPGAVPGSIPGQPAYKPDPAYQQQQMGQMPMGQPQQFQAPVGRAPVGQPQQFQAPVGQPQQFQAPAGHPQQFQAPVGQQQQFQAPVGQPQQFQAPVGQAGQQGQVPQVHDDLQAPPHPKQP